jgi:hypothetical protein
MAELTKPQLSADNQSSFPDNTTGYITPAGLRGFNQKMIDSLVDEIQYNIDSASFNAQIAALDPSGSAISVGQLNAYTASQNQKNLAVQYSTASLNAFTSSQLTINTAIGISTASLNTFTSSFDAKFIAIGASTSSLNNFTSSAGTAIINLNNFQTSQEAKNLTLAAYTGSNDTKWSTLSTTTQSFSSSIAQLNAFTASDAPSNAALNQFTASQLTINSAIGASTSSLNAFSASENTKSATLALYTASVDTKFVAVSASTSSLNTFTSSANTQLTNLSTSQSIDNTKWNTLASQTGSYALSGSFATTGSNVFVGTQTISGSAAGLVVSGSTSLRGGLTMTSGNINTVGVGVQLLNEIWALNGNNSQGSLRMYVTNGDAWIGTNNGFPTYGNANLNINASTGKEVYIAGDGITMTAAIVGFRLNGNVSSSGNFQIGQLTASLQQGYTWVGAANGRTTLVATSSFGGGSTTDITSLNAFTASQLTINTAIGASTSSLNTATSSLFTSASLGLVTASVNLNTITFTKGDKSTFAITVNTGSGGGGSTDITSLNAFTQSQDTKNSTLATYTASVNTSLTNINSFTASNGNTSLNSYTASNDTKWNTLGGQTGSYITSAQTSSMSVLSASFAVSASNIYVQNTSANQTHLITFTDATNSYGGLQSTNQFIYNPNTNLLTTTASVAVTLVNGTGSLDNTSLNAFTASQDTKNTTLGNLTGSFATTGSNTFYGVQTQVSSSYSGSLINNITPISSSLSKTTNIVTLTASEYAGITPVTTTLYIVI